MKFVPRQCDECPFHPDSMPMWLGNYTPAEVFRAIWKADPFFCHTTINYSKPDWLPKAMASGKLCTGGLLFANLIMAPDSEVKHEAIRSARLKVLSIRESVSCMNGREFADCHNDENRKRWWARPAHEIKVPKSFGKRRR